MSSYSVYTEMLAVESVDGNPIDPQQDVPFAAVRETHGTLNRLKEGENVAQ